MTQHKDELDLAKLWRAYKERQDLQARDALIDEYIPLVKYIAGRLAINLPGSVDQDDLESFGFFGLLDALEKFDPSRGIKFQTYASTRIRGAVIDGLRATDWVPRSTRSKARLLERKIQELTNSLGRSPSDEEVAAALDLTKPRYFQMLDEIKSATLLSLDESVAEGEAGLSIVDLVADDGEPVHQRLIQNETVAELSAAIEELTEREQLVLSLYYHDELTLKEIGHVLEVSESRVSQIHTKAIITLRSRLQN
ncbi:MAG TPA: FliA/WhiG family RNA polymerase sigma factor [Firmicutes bacterium]|nr:FliA/WhiG family RNA polymerase sigma factor [Bacillota bacterium]